MFINDYVIKAKEGDEKAFLWLINHFEDNFCNNVVKFNNNENLRKDAKERLPLFIRKYLDGNYKAKLDTYLRTCAHNEFKEKNKIKDTRKLNVDELTNIYSKRFLKTILKYRFILTKEELERFSLNYISKFVNTYIDDKDKFSNIINSRISYEIKYLQKEEIFFLKYIIQEGINDRIINYLCNKYSYLLQDYITKNSYFILSSCYKNILTNILINIDTGKNNITSYIKEEIYKKHVRIEHDLKEEEKNLRKDEISKKILYYSYASIKNFIFNKYKEIVNMSNLELERIINEKYDLYFNGYIKGKSKSDLRRYIINSFNNYFNFLLNKEIKYKDSEKVICYDSKRISRKS